MSREGEEKQSQLKMYTHFKNVFVFVVAVNNKQNNNEVK